MINKIKIAHLTSVHPPFDTRIFHKECKTLVQTGHEVVLIAPHECDDMIDGIKVRAVPEPKGRCERVMLTTRQVYRLALDEDADIYHFHDPELIPVGILLKLKGKKVIYDIHEDVPKQILTKPWISPVFRNIVAKASALTENVGASFFNGIIAATPTIASHFPRSKTIVVHNFPILNELVMFNSVPYHSRPLNVVYVGGITGIRGLREMIQAIELLPERLNVRLLLAGNFSPPELENEVREMHGWRRVEFLGWQTREQVATILNQARIGLVLLHPTLNYIDAYPVKLFEYMSAGIPVVASDFPLWREIVEGAGCGLLVDPLDPRAIAEAIQWLIENPEEAETMGKQGQEAVAERYNWDIEARKLLSFYEGIAKINF